MMDSLGPPALAGREGTSHTDFANDVESLADGEPTKQQYSVSALSLPVERASRPCLLQNGSFQDGLAHWVTLEGTEQISHTDTYISQTALVLSTKESGTYQQVPVTPGQIYRLMGYSCSTAWDYSSFGLSFFDRQRRFLSRSDVGAIVSAEWHDYCAIAISPTHAAYAQIWTYQNFDHGFTYIDGLSLRQIQPKDLPARAFNRFRLIHAPLGAADNIFAHAAAHVTSDEQCKAEGLPMGATMPRYRWSHWLKH